MENQPVQAAQPSPSKGLGIASLILGICSIVTAALFIGIVAGILAIIFGIIVLQRRGDKGRAITGIITGALGVLLTIAVIGVWTFAIPVMQRSARDIDRKNEVSLIVSEIQEYQMNNQGALPDPQVVSDTLRTGSLYIGVDGRPTTEVAAYVTGENCEGDTSSRAFSVTVKLEKGGTYCQGS